MAHSVLQVPVPALEPFVAARHAHHDRDWVSADPAFTHAHVTVLGPWVAEPGAADLAAVAAVAASVPAFGFVLGRIEVFPDGLVHLRPEPDEGFRLLTDRLRAAFPDHPPYGGAFEPVPHLTLDALGAGVTVASTRAALGDVLPARCRAERVDLAWWEAGGCRLLASWSLAPG